MSNLLQTARPMRTTVDAAAFLTALKKIRPILKKSSFPALEEASVRFHNGRCVLTGTDMETWIMAELSATGDDFSFVFSRTEAVEDTCRYFSGELTLEMSETGDEKHRWLVVVMSCGTRTAEFNAYPIEDYPDTPEVSGEAVFHASAADLLERIGRVAYATRKPSQEVSAISSCVQFSGHRVYALDGCRAAWDDSTVAVPQPFLLYAGPLQYLRVFGSGQVDFRFSAPRLSVSDGSTTIIYRMVEGQPFNLDSAIPQKYVETFFVCPQGLLDELRYLKAAAPKSRTPYVYLHGNKLSMTAKGRKYSTAIDIERSSGMGIGFNLCYMVDALKPFAKQKYVTVKISGPHTPIVIEAEGRSDHAMVLPLRNGSTYAAA